MILAGSLLRALIVSFLFVVTFSFVLIIQVLLVLNADRITSLIKSNYTTTVVVRHQTKVVNFVSYSMHQHVLRFFNYLV